MNFNQFKNLLQLFLGLETFVQFSLAQLENLPPENEEPTTQPFVTGTQFYPTGTVFYGTGTTGTYGYVTGQYMTGTGVYPTTNAINQPTTKPQVGDTIPAAQTTREFDPVQTTNQMPVITEDSQLEATTNFMSGSNGLFTTNEMTTVENQDGLPEDTTFKLPDIPGSTAKPPSLPDSTPDEDRQPQPVEITTESNIRQEPTAPSTTAFLTGTQDYSGMTTNSMTGSGYMYETTGYYGSTATADYYTTNAEYTMQSFDMPSLKPQTMGELSYNCPAADVIFLVQNTPTSAPWSDTINLITEYNDRITNSPDCNCQNNRLAFIPFERSGLNVNNYLDWEDYTNNDDFYVKLQGIKFSDKSTHMMKPALRYTLEYLIPNRRPKTDKVIVVILIWSKTRNEIEEEIRQLKQKDVEIVLIKLSSRDFGPELARLELIPDLFDQVIHIKSVENGIPQFNRFQIVDNLIDGRGLCEEIDDPNRPKTVIEEENLVVPTEPNSNIMRITTSKSGFQEPEIMFNDGTTSNFNRINQTATTTNTNDLINSSTNSNEVKFQFTQVLADGKIIRKESKFMLLPPPPPLPPPPLPLNAFKIIQAGKIYKKNNPDETTTSIIKIEASSFIPDVVTDDDLRKYFLGCQAFSTHRDLLLYPRLLILF